MEIMAKNEFHWSTDISSIKKKCLITLISFNDLEVGEREVYFAYNAPKDGNKNYVKRVGMR